MSGNKIVFLLTSILLLLSACQSGASATGEATNTFAASATNTPTPTKTPPPTETSTSTPTLIPTHTKEPTPSQTPFPIQGFGLEDVTVDTLCLNIKQSSPDVDERYFQSFDEPVTEFLSKAGIKVVSKGNHCDASLDIDMVINAVCYNYSVGGKIKKCCGNARLGGDMYFSLPERESIILNIQEETLPSFFTYSCPTAPGSNILMHVFFRALLKSLHEIWSFQILLKALEEPKFSTLSMSAWHVIQEFELENIVPSMIQILRNDKSLAEEAELVLYVLSGEDLGQDPDIWEQWWESQ